MTLRKAAVIGVGSMGSRHARIYAALPEIDLVAVVSATAATSTRVAVAYGCKAYTDYHAMLAAERPDLVSVAVPTVLHLDVARAALDAGCHVLVEKPVAASLDEARTLVAAAGAAGRKLMVGHIVRFDPTIQALKQHLDAGALGRIFQIVCKRVSPFPHRIRDVGVVLDLSPHDLDVMRYLTGESPSRVYAEIAQRVHATHEDHLTAQVRFPSGVLGLLEINWLAPTKIRDVSVLGEGGVLRADCIRQELHILEDVEFVGSRPNAAGAGGGREIHLPVRPYEPIKAEIEAFVDAVKHDTAVPVTGEDGLAALELALALLKSGREHRPIDT